MKKIVMMCAAVLMAACTQVEFDPLDPETPGNEQTESTPTKKFTFTMKGDFVEEMREFTRGYLQADGKDMTDLWVVDCDADGNVLQHLHQSGSADDFGKPILQLKYGTHKVYFCASRGKNPTWSEDHKSITWETVHDTFWKAYDVEVSSTSNGNRAVTMDRCVSKLKVCVKDKVPEGSANIRFTTELSPTLNLTTGKCAAGTYAYSTNIASSEIGTVIPSYSIYLFTTGEDGESTNVKIDYLNSSKEVLHTRTAENVHIETNKETKLTGSVVSSSADFTLGLTTAWGTEGIEETF